MLPTSIAHVNKSIVPSAQTCSPPPSQIKRKYFAEAGLNLFSPGPVLFRPSDIYRFGKFPAFRAILAGTNIYLICRRQRISVDPHSLKAEGGEIFGKLVVHGQSYGEWETTRFSTGPALRGPFGQRYFVAVRPADAAGHAIEAVDLDGQQTLISSCSLVAGCNHDLGDRTRLEVLYVGQTFGKEGDRLSIDRLSRHTTLQRILAESTDDSGLNEILVLGFQYSNSRNFLSTESTGHVVPLASRDEERAHMMSVPHRRLSRRERILLAEAALINYFKPCYNVLHRDSFSSSNRRKLRVLQTLLKEDFSALIVEINTSSIGAKLWSKHAPHGAMANHFGPQKIAEMYDNVQRTNSESTSPTSREEFDAWIADQTHAHIAKFALYEPSERETFLHSLPWTM